MKRSLFLLLLTIPFLFSFLPGKAQKTLYIDSDWVKEQEPFRIAGNLYYVGSYDLGCYLITTPKGHILVNTGAPGSDTIIRKHVEELGFRYTDIRILLLNQAHYDHTGGLAAIVRATGAKMMVEEKDDSVLSDGGNSDFYMGGQGEMFEPVKAFRLLHDKDIVSLGGMKILILHHPGHTKGSTSFLFTVKDSARSFRVLIANIPSILDRTTFPSMPEYPEVGKDYAYTLSAMPKLQFDIWLAAHASQFDLQKKHKPGDGYHPEVFFDRPLYDSTIAQWQEVYKQRTSK